MRETKAGDDELTTAVGRKGSEGSRLVGLGIVLNEAINEKIPWERSTGYKRILIASGEVERESEVEVNNELSTTKKWGAAEESTSWDKSSGDSGEQQKKLPPGQKSSGDIAIGLASYGGSKDARRRKYLLEKNLRR